MAFDKIGKFFGNSNDDELENDQEYASQTKK